MQESESWAFPRLTEEELTHIEPLGENRWFDADAVVFQAGDRDIDLWIVREGALEIINPTDENRRVALHKPGEFAGDIDLLTRRPAVVTAIARDRTCLLRVPGSRVREVLLRLPSIGEKLLVAFQARREILSRHGHVGLKVTGPAQCPDTNLVREFLDKNFVPYVWNDVAPAKGESVEPEAAHGLPIVDCGGGVVLRHPKLQELARCAGVWQECPIETVDVAIVGGGPAGLSSAVYAASEGLTTLVLDSLGPGGQAAASSKIENFIGFPSGLSGTQLATRGVIQMLKFGAQLIAPVSVLSLEPGPDGAGFYFLHLDCGSAVRARNVLVSTGLRWRRLSALGSSPFEHAGIYYACTTTETVAHQGQEVAVVGAGNSAGQAAMFLAEQCAEKVHLLMRGDDLRKSMSSYLVDRIEATPNIQVHRNVQITRILSDGRLKGVEVTNDNNECVALPITALFVFIGAEPEVNWLPDTIARDPKGYLLTGADAAATGCWPLKDREPCTLETTMPRVFAAGDVRSSSTKRVGFAVGDGALAVACIHSLR